jgi:hypothetical protein
MFSNKELLMKTFLLPLILALSLHATTVTSITCSGQTATVNSTAHGLVASQGFSLSGTAATFNSTTFTVATNSLTFVLPAGVPCSGFTSGYTAIIPAKQIIDLGSAANPSTATVTLNYLYWFTTAYPNPLPCPNSICPTSQWSGASAAENAAIVAGTTVETVGQINIPASTNAPTVQTIVISQYNAMQVGFANYLLAGGYWWNGTAWTNQ